MVSNYEIAMINEGVEMKMVMKAILFVILSFILMCPSGGFSQTAEPPAAYSVTPDGKKHPAASLTVSSSKSPSEDIDYKALLEKIVIGKTTESEVIKLLGNPARSQTYSEYRNNGWEPQGTTLFYEGKDKNGNKLNINITLNKARIVSKKEIKK
jgi:hypothetical protein